MQNDRLQILQQAYAGTSASKTGDFAQAIAKLMMRYKNGHTTGKYQNKDINQTASPLELSDGLITSLGVTTELFASPLNFNPRMQTLAYVV